MSSSALERRLLLPATSSIYTDKDLRNQLWHIHGILMCAAFLFIYPAGIIAIRSGSHRALRYHQLLQLSGMLLALTGIAVGILVSTRVTLLHQYIGFAMGAALLAQPVLGWKHHVDFRRLKRRTWISYSHMWIGRVGMALGWINILLGLVLRDYHFLVQAGAGVVMLCYVVLWMLWGLGVMDTSPGIKVSKADEHDGLMTSVGNEFALDDFDEHSEGEEDDDRLKSGHK